MYVCSNGIKTAVVLQDPQPLNPRKEQENLARIVSWDRRISADAYNFDNAQEFAECMCSAYLKIPDVFRGIQNGCVEGYQLREVESVFSNGKQYGPAYNLERYGRLPGDEGWHGTDWFVTKDFKLISSGGQELEDLFERFITKDLLSLLDHSNQVAIKTLYLYDHSVQSISTGSFVGRAHQAQWDSGPVGFVYMDKKTAIENMAMATDEIRLAMPLEGDRKVRILSDSHDFDGVMRQNGYTQVKPEDLAASAVLESAEGQKCLALAGLGQLYKKDHRLWVLDQKDSSGGRVNAYDIKAIFSYNPGLTKLTDETWKDRAFEAIEGEVKEYDNYLQGEVYGYKLYEGLVEVESCWGFNPGREDIKDLMEDELRGWFGSKMEFEEECGEHFDIEEYLEGNEFPKLWNKIEQDVKDFIVFTDGTSQIYPFGMAAEDILNNKDDVLDEIVGEIYDQHAEYDTDRIYQAVEGHAGISREVQPKLRASDLDPERDYTAQEIMELMKAKAPLDSVIGACERANKRFGKDEKGRGPERDDR